MASPTLRGEADGHYQTVRLVLGHKDLDMTIRFYIGLAAEFAAISFDATALSDRKASRAQATGVFGAMAAAKARRAGITILAAKSRPRKTSSNPSKMHA